MILEKDVHRLANIHPSVKIGKDVSIGAFCIIGENVEIGDGCKIHPHSIILKNTQLGTHNTVHSFSVIGADPQVKSQDNGNGKLLIGDRNVFHEYCTISRGYEALSGVSTIGHHNVFMTGAHVGHDCKLGDHITLVNHVSLAGSVELENNVTISAQSVVHQFVRVGALSFLSAYSKVTMDIAPFFMYANRQGQLKSVGLNKEGLKRASLTKDDLSSLKDVYKKLIKDRVLSSELPELQKTYNNTYVNDLINFIQRSQRGWHR